MVVLVLASELLVLALELLVLASELFVLASELLVLLALCISITTLHAIIERCPQVALTGAQSRSQLEIRKRRPLLPS